MAFPPEKIRALAALALIALIAAILVWNSRSTSTPQAATLRNVAAAPTSQRASPAVPVGADQPPTVRESLSSSGRTMGANPGPGAPPPSTDPGEPKAASLATATGVTGLDPAGELEQVQMTIRDFRTVHGENPVGTNAEITRALMGDNLKQIKLPTPTGSQLNAAGELCDRWGTPYFFHQVSKGQMEVRSAGPDRRMWTNDDRQTQ